MTGNPPAPIRAAIYARFSSHLQDPKSIEDQVRLCREKLREIGVHAVRVHSDAAATGTITQSRPGLARLLQDAKYGLIDLVCAEALDRLSRDQEDIAGIYKRLRFWNVRLMTLQEGEIGSIHVGIGGLVNQAFIENLASKTRRGQIGAVHAKRIPGGLSYGYRNANRIDEHGKTVRGLREIDPEQAETVRRIYRLYADGMSTRNIAPPCSTARTSRGRAEDPGLPTPSTATADAATASSTTSSTGDASSTGARSSSATRTPGSARPARFPRPTGSSRTSRNCASSTTRSGTACRPAGRPARTDAATPLPARRSP